MFAAPPRVPPPDAHVVDYSLGCFGVADSANDKAQQVMMESASGNTRYNRSYEGTWASGGGTLGGAANISQDLMGRIHRISGSLRIVGGSGSYHSLVDGDTAENKNGFGAASVVSDSNTYTRLFIAVYRQAVNLPGTAGFRFIRRFQ